MNRKRRKRTGVLLAVIISAVLLAGCGKSGNSLPGDMAESDEKADGTGEPADGNSGEENNTGEAVSGKDKTGSGIGYESAQDTVVDFEALKKENPDIFAWIYIPGTDIDYPVLQSSQSDDYYEKHDAYGRESEKGAVYTELANLTNMCDFNTVIHGKSLQDGGEGLFNDLYQFGDPDFFDSHKDIYLYLEENLLVYTVFAAYERENSSLIRSYDFTYGDGCGQFLADLYSTREMGKNLREGWEGLTPYHFLITLTTTGAGNPDRQFIVVAALVEDAAGKIDRTVEWLP